MFEFIRTHSRVALFALVLLIIPSFVFFGLEGYSGFRESGRDTVATVDGHPITRAELDDALARQVDRVRRQAPNIAPSLFDTPEMKRRTLDSLVNERVVLAAAVKANLSTTDERLLQAYRNDPQFASFRNPDGSVNKEALQAALSAQGMSISGFEASLRQDLAARQVMAGVAGSATGSSRAASAAFDALFQQREAEIKRFEAKSFADQVKPTDAEIEAYYKDPVNAARFQSNEQVDIQYVVLDLESLKKGVQVSEEDLRNHYTQNAARFSTPEERRASHILINAPASAPESEKKAAREKADALLAQLRKNPASFADLARKNSQDEGSAARGGDLDFFSRGAMVKPFEDVAYALKQGEISDVVTSDFGFHIIQLTGVRGGEKKPFEAVRSEIENEVRQQVAQREYTEAANEFTNTVYEQAESLQPVADKLKLEVKTAKAVTRAPDPASPDAAPLLQSQKLLEAVFSDDVLNNKRNTEAIETGPNQLVSARVVAHRPASTRPLAEVTPTIREALVRQQSAVLARKAGEALLAKAKAEPSTSVGTAQVVSRMQGQALGAGVVDAVLKSPSGALPAFNGVDAGNGDYVVVKVTKVLGRDPAAAAEPERLKSQYAQLWAAAEMQAYTQALRTRFKASIKDDAVPAAVSAPASR